MGGNVGDGDVFGHGILASGDGQSAYSVASPLEAILKPASTGELVRRGQGTVEYMLTMSVVSLAIVAIMLSFDLIWQPAVTGLSENMADETLVDQDVQEP